MVAAIRDHEKEGVAVEVGVCVVTLASGHHVIPLCAPSSLRGKWEGRVFSNARGRTDTPKIVDRHTGHSIHIDGLIIHRLKLDPIDESLDLMNRDDSIRSAVVH